MKKFSKKIITLLIFIFSILNFSGCHGTGSVSVWELEKSKQEEQSSTEEESSIEEITNEEEADKTEEADETEDSDDSEDDEEEFSSFGGIDSIDQITDVSARINWTQDDNAVAYEVYDVTSDVTYLTTIIAPAEVYELSDLKNETAYTFRVRVKYSS